ncbi:MAG TPA: 6-bladed beta-propeller [Draconibacterium sp.]|nr:6-bladed beta-propeller [Draconibacterium sp.]
MMKEQIFCLLLIVGTIGITPQVCCQTEEILKLEYNFKEAEPLKMSEIISEISYIPLETNPSCLLGYMWIPVFGEDILVNTSDGGESIYRFSSDGKYLNTIGRKGNGPNEYNGCTDLFLQGDTVYIVSNFTDDILCYSLTGEFLKKYKLEVERPKHVVQLPDKSFMITLTTDDKLGNLIKTDKEFNIQAGYIKNLPFPSNPLPCRFQNSNDKIFYYNTFLDTIYNISNGSPIPSIIVDYGKYRVSNERHPENRVLLNSPNIHEFSTCDNYYKLDVYYPYKGDVYSMLYRISDGKKHQWSSLINDIDNGTLDRWPGFLSGDRLIFHLMPLTILERYENMTKEEKLDPANSAFVDMASSISPDSNPVIMVCKLK